jgi:hypothetical protein
MHAVETFARVWYYHELGTLELLLISEGAMSERTARTGSALEQYGWVWVDDGRESTVPVGAG